MKSYKIFFIILLVLIVLSGNGNKEYSISKLNYHGERLERASDYLVRKANNEYVKSYNEGNKKEMYSFNNDEYRYIGNIPNNYVYFNCNSLNNLNTCEIWRIIGVFKIEDEMGSNYRIKLMKDEVVTNNLDSLNNIFIDNILNKYQKMISNTKYKVDNIDTYYKINITNDYDKTKSFGFNGDSWLNNNTYPCVYLIYNTIMSSGNGSLGDPYLIKVVSDNNVNEEYVSNNQDDKDIIEVSDTSSNLSKIILIVCIVSLVIGSIVIGINYYKSRKIRKHYNS